MNLTKDQARVFLLEIALQRLNEAEDGLPLAQLFSIDKSTDAVVTSQSTSKFWQRAVMDRLVESNMVGKVKEGSTVIYFGDSNLREQVEAPEEDFRLFVKKTLFPQDYEQQEQDAEEEPDAEVKEATEQGMQLLTGVLNDLGDDEKHAQAEGKLFLHLIMELHDHRVYLSELSSSLAKHKDTFAESVGIDLERDTAFEAKLNDMGESQARISSRFRSMDERLSSIEEKVGRMDKRVKSLPELKENMEELSKQVTYSIASVVKELADVRNAAAQMMAVFRELAGRFDLVARAELVRGQVQTWVSMFKSMESQSKDALAGVEVMVDLAGKLEVENNGGDEPE